MKVTAVAEPSTFMQFLQRWDLVLFVFITVLIFLFSNPKVSNFDQSFVIARALLQGELGVPEPMPWLELVAGETLHYSVMPLGSVLSTLPFALLAEVGLISKLPMLWIAAGIAASSFFFAFLLCEHYRILPFQKHILVIVLIFGNWMWCNLVFGGSWQLALGFGMLGQLGAIYFLLVRQNPLWAGIFFALAFGNRTELIVTGPLYLVFLLRRRPLYSMPLGDRVFNTLLFSIAPLLLLIATMAYNYARFFSLFDMGYERIPYVHDMAGFENGLLSLSAIPMNLHFMLLKPFVAQNEFPYFHPTHFGESIFLCCPFLLLIFRPGARSVLIKYTAVCFALLITFVLFIHGNAGAYQYGYRYAIELLPWLFLILLESNKRYYRYLEAPLAFVSVFISTYSVYWFYWRPNA